MAATRSLWVPILLAVVLIVAGAAAAGYVYGKSRSPGPTPLLTIREGYNVTVNYIGEFATGPQAGRVFDTSIYAVAQNNLTYPKSLLYQPRSNESAYTPLDVHVGPTTPSGGYVIHNISFISVIPGFWQGIIGLSGNRTVTVVIPPSLGYGPLNPACLVSEPLTYTMPVVVTLLTSQFTSQYPGVTPTAGAIVSQPIYHWPVMILSVNTTSVVLLNQPTLGFVSSPYGWPVQVTNITRGPGGGNLTLHNELSVTQAGLVKGTLPTNQTVCHTGTFVVSSVNLADGTFTENFNSQVAGATLKFIITAIDIFPPK
jgi:FKBP-type peptidyl-prolyl cis-trans isomerase 2